MRINISYLCAYIQGDLFLKIIDQGENLKRKLKIFDSQWVGDDQQTKSRMLPHFQAFGDNAKDGCSGHPGSY